MFKRQKHLVIREISPEDAIYSMMTIKNCFNDVSVQTLLTLKYIFLIKKKTGCSGSLLLHTGIL